MSAAHAKKLSKACAPRGPLDAAPWHDPHDRLHALQALLALPGEPNDLLPYMWRMERAALQCSRGVRVAYMQLMAMLLNYLRTVGTAQAMVDHPDSDRLPWIGEQYLMPNDAIDALRQACADKAHRVDQLRGVQLEVPEDLAGGMHCRKCGSHNLCVEMRQTRAADEGMTAFMTCGACGHRW